MLAIDEKKGAITRPKEGEFIDRCLNPLQSVIGARYRAYRVPACQKVRMFVNSRTPCEPSSRP